MRERSVHGCLVSVIGISWQRQRVLLLNATYEPLTVVSTRRAIVLTITGRAETVHEDEDHAIAHSEQLAVPVPSVIRLRHFVRVPYRAQIPMTRAALMRRDASRCVYCGSRATTIDHVVPRSRGGQNTWDNCVACCAPCNRRKADRMLHELGWSLNRQPVAPKGRHWRLLATVSDIDPVWEQYLAA
ncbi:HNH endonuclease [Gordonia araii]|uniref:HNH endonuclease n=1 Tax=Gordonia araii TaxID=263909 RepID=UPI001FE19DB8